MSLAACEPTKGFMSRAAREPNILLLVRTLTNVLFVPGKESETASLTSAVGMPTRTGTERY